MAKIIGRRLSIGIAKEAVRGTALDPTYWLPKMELTQDDKIEQIVDESSVGVIEDAQNADVVLKSSDGELKGRINDTSFGLWILSALGTEAAPALVETGVYDHAFSVSQSAQHPSLTVSVSEANAGVGLRFALSMVDSLEMNVELARYAEYTAKFRGNTSAVDSVTPSYTAENIFLPQHGELKLATSLAGLDAASAISIKKFTLTISKNLEDDQVIGNVNASDRLNKQFMVEGSMELLYEDRTFIDTLLVGDAARALRIRLTNSAVTIGATSNPRLTIELAKVKISEVARSQGNNDIIRQTVNFKGFYSLTDAKMITAVLRNTLSAAY